MLTGCAAAEHCSNGADGSTCCRGDYCSSETASLSPEVQATLCQEAHWALAALGAAGLSIFWPVPEAALQLVRSYGPLGPDLAAGLAQGDRDDPLERSLRGMHCQMTLAPSPGAGDSAAITRLRDAGVQAVMVVPLGDYEPIGILAIAWREPHLPTDPTLAARAVAHIGLALRNAVLEAGFQTILSLFARYGATALDVAQFYARAHRVAVLEHRQALARNLHSSVMQTLYSLDLFAQVAAQAWEERPDRAREALEMVRRLARDAGTDLRSLLFELDANALDSEGLVPAVERYVDLVRQSNLPVDLHHKLGHAVPTRFEEAM